MHFLRRHRVILIAAAAFAACLFVFAVFWQLDVRQAAGKSRSAYLNDLQQEVTVPAETGIEQTFFCDVPFYKLGVLPAFRGEVLPGTLTLTVYDSTGTPLSDPVQGKAAETVSGQYAVFSFPHALKSPDGTYRLVFEAAMDNPEDAFSLVKSKESLPGWALKENGEPAEGSLCLLATVDVIGGFVNRFYLAFALLASAALGAVTLLVQCRGKKVSTLFLCCAAMLGLLSCLIFPPYSAPDEEAYINRAFNLSSSLLGQTDGPIPPGTVVRRASDNDVTVQESGTTVFTYRELARQALSRATDATPTEFAGESAAGCPVFSLPAVLGLTLARLAGLGLVPALYLGRLFHLAAYILLAGLAVKVSPTRKTLLAAAGLFPLSIHLGASYNPTGLVLAAVMLGLALCLRAAGQAPLSLSGYLLPCAVVLLSAGSAPGYLLTSLLLIPLAGKAVSFKGRPLPKSITNCILMGAIILCVLFCLGPLLAGEDPLATAAPKGTGSAENLLKALFGGLLGDYNLSLNWGFTLALLMLLAFALLPEPQDTPLLLAVRGTRGWLLTAVLGGAVLLALTEGFTVRAALLAVPLLPLLLCALSRSWGGLIKKRDYTPFLLTAFSGVTIFSLLDAFLLILTR